MKQKQRADSAEGPSVSDHPSGPRSCPENPHAALPFMEQYVLWGIRLWFTGLRTEFDMVHKIHEGFSRRGAPNAAKSLDRLMTTLTADLQCQFIVNVGNLNDVSEDEDLILNALAQCQAGNSEVIKFWLADLVPASLLSLTTTLFEEFSVDLIEGRLFVNQDRIRTSYHRRSSSPSFESRQLH